MCWAQRAGAHINVQLRYPADTGIKLTHLLVVLREQWTESTTVTTAQGAGNQEPSSCVPPPALGKCKAQLNRIDKFRRLISLRKRQKAQIGSRLGKLWSCRGPVTAMLRSPNAVFAARVGYRADRRFVRVFVGQLCDFDATAATWNAESATETSAGTTSRTPGSAHLPLQYRTKIAVL